MKQPYIIIVVGTSCSGKSTLIKELQKSLIGSYHIGYDKVKWNLAGYHRDRDQGTIGVLLQGFLEKILENGINCISDMIIRNENQYKEIKTLTEKYNYHIVFIALDCPLNIRLERFHDLVRRASLDPNSKISVTDEFVFLENSRKPVYFPENAIILDTSRETLEDITQTILQKLQ